MHIIFSYLRYDRTKTFDFINYAFGNPSSADRKVFTFCVSGGGDTYTKHCYFFHIYNMIEPKLLILSIMLFGNPSYQKTDTSLLAFLITVLNSVTVQIM